MTFEISIVTYNFLLCPNTPVNVDIIISQKMDYLNVQTINVNLDAEFTFHKHRCFVKDAMKYEIYIYLVRPKTPVIVGKYKK